MAGKPKRSELPAADVRGFRRMIAEALAYSDGDAPAPVASTRWGVYAFYDYDDEPIYVGQTNEKLAVRVRRHLTNQRTDAVGIRVLDPYEILMLELWPLFGLEGVKKDDAAARHYLNRLERTIYERALSRSKFGAILNEKIPPEVELIPDDELPTHYRFQLIPAEVLEERRHPDNRIARRGETLGRLTNVVRERGEVTDGLRRVVIVQAARLAWLASQRLAEVQGRTPPAAVSDLIHLPEMVGGVKAADESDDDTDA